MLANVSRMAAGLLLGMLFMLTAVTALPRDESARSGAGAYRKLMQANGAACTGCSDTISWCQTAQRLCRPKLAVGADCTGAKMCATNYCESQRCKIRPSSSLTEVLREGFDVIPPAGWVVANRGTAPQGSLLVENSFAFEAHSGGVLSQANLNFGSILGSGTISTWLIMPTLNLGNGSFMTFWTRTISPSYSPDRLQVRLSLGAGTDVGTLPDDVGTFSTLLLSVNPDLTLTGYPADWTQYTVIVSGLAGPTPCRFAFRYYVTDGGPSGANSNWISIDTVSVVATTP